MPGIKLIIGKGQNRNTVEILHHEVNKGSVGPQFIFIHSRADHASYFRIIIDV